MGFAKKLSLAIKIGSCIYIGVVILELVLNTVKITGNRDEDKVIVFIGILSREFLRVLNAMFYVAFSFVLDILMRIRHEKA